MFSQEILWKKKVQTNKPIHALSITHDKVAVGAGKRVFIFDSESGEILNTLLGHRDEVYTVSFSHDGELLASGGCDKSTIIWGREGKGILKFSFSTSVQVLAFNPLQSTLASCSNGEVGFWQPNTKTVKKTKVDSKILSVAWRSDGKAIVVGTASGDIFVMDAWGSITRTMQRNAPIWALTWNVDKDTCGHDDGVLVVGSWDSKIAIYKDVELVKEINTKGFATSLSSINNRGSISPILYIISSTENGVSIMNQAGVVVSKFPHESDWIWCVQSKIVQNGIGKIVYVDNEASLVCSKLKVTPFLVVSDDVIASCENGSKLSIQNFRRGAHEVVEYECSSLIRGLAVSSKCAYVLAENSLLVLEIQTEDELKFNIEHVNNIFVDVGDGAMIQSVDNDKFLLACTTTLILYNAKNGEIIKKWELDSTVNYFDSKSYGYNNEVLVGCEKRILRINKNTLEIREVMNVDFEFKQFSSSKCGTLLAVLDQENSLHLFNTEKKRFHTSIQDAVSSFLFHDEVSELLCIFHSNVDISLCYKNVHSLSSQFQGRKPVAFRGGDFIFFESGQIYVEKIDFGKLIEECISVGEFQVSFQLARYERNTEIWDLLATRALAKKRFDVAREVYSEIQDNEKTQMVERVKVFVEQSEHLEGEETLLKLVLAEVDAMDGFVIDAIETFVSLNAFDRAIELALALDKREGKDQILRIIQKLPDPPLGSSFLRQCCIYLLNLNDIEVEELLMAKLEELQDCDLLLSFYVKSKSWVEVEKFFANRKGEFDPNILLPYGEFLAGKGDIETALQIYRDASRTDKTDLLFHVLLRDAIAYESWDQVSKFLWLASKESDYREDHEMRILNAKLSSNDLQILSRFFLQYYRITDFSAAATMTPATMFRACSYSLNLILQHQSIKVFLPKTMVLELLFLFAKVARNVRCYKSARFAYDMLVLDYEDVLESKRKEALADDMMTIELMPMEDDEEFFDICFRCGSTQDPLIEGGQSCLSCEGPFIRCNITLNTLPVVEFKLSPSMDSLQEIVCCSEPDDGLLFNNALDLTLANSHGVYKPVEVSENVLKSMDRCDIYILHGKYYKCTMKELGVAVCPSCSSFFEEKELELYLSRYNTSSCPVCSEKAKPTIALNETSY